jgi:hypothetical protein
VRVFDALKDKVPTYTNDMFLAIESNPMKKVIHEFIATSIDEQLPTDYAFGAWITVASHG